MFDRVEHQSVPLGLQMKYRVIELLKCPKHPESMLRIKNAQLSDVFPFAGKLQVPVCRSGCGFLGNWFADIPESLPPQHRLDCRRCLGTEIETGVLTCPDCDWGFEIKEGILSAEGEKVAVDGISDLSVRKKVGFQIENLLSLEPGEIILELETLPESLTETWCASGVEQIQVEVDSKSVQDCRARSCTRGLGTIYHFNGPLRLDVFREEILDAVVMANPTGRLQDFDNSLADMLGLLRPSGQALLVYRRDKRGRGSLEQRHDAILDQLPDEFRKFRTSLIDAHGLYFLHIEHPEPENGFVVHKVDAYADGE